MTGGPSLFSDQVRERLTDVDHGIHHNGNDHRGGPLANCPKCVAVGLLAELDALVNEMEKIPALAHESPKAASIASAALVKAVEGKRTKQESGSLVAAQQVLDLRLDTLELLALALAHYGDAVNTRLGDVIPRRVWNSLYERDLLRAGQNNADEGYCTTTHEGLDLLIRSVEELAEQTEPS